MCGAAASEGRASRPSDECRYKKSRFMGMTGLSGNELTAPLIPPPALPGRLTSCSPAVTTEIESLSLVTARLATCLQTISGPRPDGISWTQFEKNS